MVLDLFPSPSGRASPSYLSQSSSSHKCRFHLGFSLAWFDLLWDQCDEPVDFFSESSPGETGPFSEELGRGELESCGN